MNKKSIAVLVSLLAAASVAQAQSQGMSPSTEIRESTDPARVAEVERRAQELMSRQQTSPGMGASSGSSDAAASERQMKRAKDRTDTRRDKAERGSAGSR